MQISHLDHFVLTVQDLEHSLEFYSRVLGMKPMTFGAGRRALAYGRQKINLHQAGSEFEPKAGRVQPGSADLCFISPTPMDEILTHLQAQGVSVLEGPVERTGAQNKLFSVYFRDPDGNLIEVSNERS